MFSIKPKDNLFFELFSGGAEICCKSANALKELMNCLDNPQEQIDVLTKLEHEGDQITHQLIEHTKKMFITPLDREDIYNITKGIDTITDDIEAAAHRFYMYNIDKPTQECLEIIDKLVLATQSLLIVVGELKTLHKGDLMLEKIIEVNTIENEADVIYRNAIKKVFSEPSDYLTVIKWKDLYKYLETSIDSCEKLANEIRGVVMKYA